MTNKNALINKLLGKSQEEDLPNESIDASNEISEASEEITPYEALNHTERGLSENPVLRVSFWVLTIVSLTGGAIWAASNIDLSKSANKTKPGTASASQKNDPVVQADDKEGRIAFGDQDIEQSKANAMLTAQQRADAYEAKQKSLREAEKKRLNAKQANQPKPPAPNNTIQLPKVPKSSPVPRTIRPTQKPTPRPSTPPRTAQSSASAPSAPRPNPIKEIAAPDPMQLYASLDQIGNYGHSNWTGSNGSGDSSVAASSGNFLDGVQQDTYMDPGDTIEMTLDFPIVWGDNLPTQPTLATITKGNQHLPEGTQMRILASGDRSGIVQVDTIEIMDGESSYPLSGTMQITKDNGKPLKGKKKGGPGFLSSIGLKSALGVGSSIASGALSNNSLSVNTGSTTVRQGSTAISDAVRDGSESIIDGLEERNNASIQQQRDQEYFVVDSGKSIKVSAISVVGG